VITWLQRLLFNSNLYRYTGTTTSNSSTTRTVGLHKLNPLVAV
jgi:hypothetical protein